MLHFNNNYGRDIAINDVMMDVPARHLTHGLTLAAHEAALRLRIAPSILLSKLEEEEQRRSCAIGQGVAIPVLALAEISQPYTIFLQLREGVDGDAPDNQPVDLICLMIAPASDKTGHLRRLSRMTRLLREEKFCRKLREAKNPAVLRALFTSADETRLAA